MRHLVSLALLVALALTAVPSLLVAAGKLTLADNRTLMAAGTVLWFASVSLLGRLKAR